ncbi:hypothetical protein [Methylocella silvestris]|uniref:Uncharacterized protein n=1 Tax=Methylocella silvestris TaxID=199596 RepID=A0A2J7TLF3_METSI|nr:hypothetical protein [Methylocella silvestris]PNG27601.1 hypothetical protein CR492_01405 [Methylocella silvestris]
MRIVIRSIAGEQQKMARTIENALSAIKAECRRASEKQHIQLFCLPAPKFARNAGALDGDFAPGAVE